MGEKEIFKIKSDWVGIREKSIFWIGCLLIVVLVYDFQGVAFKNPYGMHQWRQSDAYSMALNFAQEDRSLWNPEMHFQHGNAGGEAIGEFPLTYCLNGNLWKMLGSIAPWTMRWIHLMLLLLGMGALFRLFRTQLPMWFSAGAVWLVMASGLLAFYGPNYLVNAGALGLVFAGWWAAFRWSETGLRLNGWLGLMLLSLTMAVLLRPTMALGWIPLFIASIRIRHKGRWILACGLPLFIGAAYVWWTKGVNAANESTYFLTTIRPIWLSEDPGQIWKSFREDVLPQWYHFYVLIALLIALTRATFLGLRMNSTNRFFVTFLAFLGTAVGLLIYFLLWFDNLNVHDYYLIEFQLLVPLALALLGLAGQQSSFVPSAIGRVLFICLLLFQLTESAIRTRMKYRVTKGVLAELLIPSRELKQWEWFHWDQNLRFANSEDWKGLLRSHGINREELVISVPDPSPNITLSIMDQKGFTDLYDNHLVGNDRIAHYVGLGAKYLLCNDERWYQKHESSPWLTKQMTQLGNFRVFELLESNAHLQSNSESSSIEIENSETEITENR
ncbi:MAG: hypothetical protein O3B11_04915 [Bacteroidetes bacterium]|nr:hypothetical protein [Bacteroidota bacterium]